MNSVGISKRSSNSSRHMLSRGAKVDPSVQLRPFHSSCQSRHGCLITAESYRIIQYQTVSKQGIVRRNTNIMDGCVLWFVSFAHLFSIPPTSSSHKTFTRLHLSPSSLSFSSRHSTGFLRFLPFRSKAPRLSPRHHAHPARTLEHSRHTVARSCERIPSVPFISGN